LHSRPAQKTGSYTPESPDIFDNTYYMRRLRDRADWDAGVSSCTTQLA
jgi:hypothetical protein